MTEFDRSPSSAQSVSAVTSQSAVGAASATYGQPDRTDTPADLSIGNADPARTTVPGAQGTASGPSTPFLALQRSVGNASVTALLRRTTSRSEEPTATGPDSKLGEAGSRDVQPVAAMVPPNLWSSRPARDGQRVGGEPVPSPTGDAAPSKRAAAGPVGPRSEAAATPAEPVSRRAARRGRRRSACGRRGPCGVGGRRAARSLNGACRSARCDACSIGSGAPCPAYPRG